MANGNEIVLIHGYSDEGKSFETWRQKLIAHGYAQEKIHVCSYVSLCNEVTIKDIAEGFDRAMRREACFKMDEPFDVIVHSTGMLVARAWLANFPNRMNRLKHLIALAPATFGSPLAHKGRSWLGSIFKGNKDVGPDFMDAGDLVLDGLELGSQFTWSLAHVDMLGKETFYGPTEITPYVFIFCGNKPYDGLRRVVSEPGTDGTVRWAGCALNTRKLCLDLSLDQKNGGGISKAKWSNIDIPLTFIENLNHGTILSNPSDVLVDLVDKALQVSTAEAFALWQKNAQAYSKAIQNTLPQFQQFIVRATDERGDPVSDFNIQLFKKDGHEKEDEMEEFDVDVHTYTTDPSYRCFHVNLSEINLADIKPGTQELWIRVRASTGTRILGYQGFALNGTVDEFYLDITSLVNDPEIQLFYPFTTTLLELKLNREPMPLMGKNDVFWFLASDDHAMLK